MSRFIVIDLDEGLLSRIEWQDELGAEGDFIVSEDQVLTILRRLFEREIEVKAAIDKVSIGINDMFHLAGGRHNSLVEAKYKEAESGLVRLDSLIHYNIK